MGDRTIEDEGVCAIGDKEIAVLIPARYGDRTLIKVDLREQAACDIREELSKLAGGASGKDERLAGSFLDDGSYVIDEPVIRIYAKVKDDFLANEKNKKRFVALAKDLCGRLEQQSIGAEWGGFLYFVSGKQGGGLKRLAFRRLHEDLQHDYLMVTLRRVRSVADVAYLLFLDCWTKIDSQNVAPAEGLLPLCQKRDQTAWVAAEPLDSGRRRSIHYHLRSAQRDHGPQSGDLIFSPASDTPGQVEVWLCQGGCLRGSRRLWLVNDEGCIRRVSYQLARSLLGATDAEEIAAMIDREGLTDRFFAEYHRLWREVADVFAIQGLTTAEAGRESQLLLGRLMFLRFIERKGALPGPGDFLCTAFKQRKGNFHAACLEPLFFDVLDQPSESRPASENSSLPYLNGGLFRPPCKRGRQIPDELFDPARSGSILDVFYRFDFTLDETAAAQEDLSVDPTMFGRVLESLYGRNQQKLQGVHYTPEAIEYAMALEPIVARLAERAAIDPEKLRRFALGEDLSLLSFQEVDRLLGIDGEEGLLFQLRILDPAVSSGSLLLAALRVLLRIFDRCKARLGEMLVTGGRTWSRAARRLVQGCLFGVDLDPGAVEVAKLRLWLALALWDDELRPLPDLRHNLCCGNSLSPLGDPEAEAAGGEVRGLSFSALEEAKNAFSAALSAYRKAEGRAAGDALEKAERDLAIVRLELEDSAAARRQLGKLWAGEPVPFRWPIHFDEVFAEDNRGFDVVIAKPPHVRVQKLPSETLADYKARFPSMPERNPELYFAFVEQALRLAGQAGRVALIIPNCARTQAARSLRGLLAKRGAVELWVDFTDVQVLPKAAKDMALLFASAKRSRARTFSCRTVSEQLWNDRPEDWLREAPLGSVSYQDEWVHLDDESK